MTRAELQGFLAEVRSGALSLEVAHDRLLQFYARLPFEDLGFARVDHHRALRQGCPEVIFGPGKTPGDYSHRRTHRSRRGKVCLSRTDRASFDAVFERVPKAEFHELARTITLAWGTATRPRHHCRQAAAGTADLPVAEEAAVSAELMGNVVDRLYDVGVAGLHRLLAEHARLMAARVIIVVAGMEGPCRASLAAW